MFSTETPRKAHYLGFAQKVNRLNKPFTQQPVYRALLGSTLLVATPAGDVRNLNVARKPRL
jgi:hypothetical protein